MNPKRSKITEELVGASVLLENRHDARLDHGQHRYVVGEDTETAAVRWHVHLLNHLLVVEHLETNGRDVSDLDGLKSEPAQKRQAKRLSNSKERSSSETSRSSMTYLVR